MILVNFAGGALYSASATSLVQFNPLSESPVQVRIAAIHDEMLGGRMARLFWREKKYCHGGDLFALRHTVAEGNALRNLLEFGVRVGLR